MPTQSNSPSTAEFRTSSLQFWRALAASDEQACRDALELLKDVQGGEPGLGAFSDFTTSPDSTFGTFLKVVLPQKSPKNAQDAWNSPKPTSLVRVDPTQHCLAFDGDVAKYPGEEGVFVACGLPGGQSLAPDACTTQTHRGFE